jgi:hypothetical protein
LNLSAAGGWLVLSGINVECDMQARSWLQWMATPIADALALAPYGHVNVTQSLSSTTLVRHNRVKRSHFDCASCRWSSLAIVVDGAVLQQAWFDCVRYRALQFSR